MNHLDPDDAALLALGEPLERDSASEHLDACAECQREVAALRETVTVARSTLDEAALQSPPPGVWARISRELALAEDLAPVAHAPAEAPANAEPVSSLSEMHAKRAQGLRRFVAPLIAASAAAALIVAAALTWNAAAPPGTGEVLASAQLEALPAWAGSTGTAEVAQVGEGDRVLRVSLAANGAGMGVREVWLLTEEVDGLISLGLLEGGVGEFVIPAAVDLERFSVVDVSQEPLDGDPTHSGDSIVRGPLGT